jgi:FkbM family methyltransferase
MSHPPANNFRTATLAERLAQSMPSGRVFAGMRRLVKPLFERVLGGADGVLRSVLPGGEIVRIAPRYRHITWNEQEYAAFRAAVRAGDVIVEAGANVGAYTMLFAQWAGPAGRVIAFEPDPVAFAGLQAHLALNDLTARVTPVASAVADHRTGRLRFALFESSGISRLATASEVPGTIVRDVESTSIDAYCVAHGVSPRVIKIDVEGAELAVLSGARRTIAEAGPRLHLFVEMHPHLWPSLGITAGDVQREIETQGLAAEHLDGSGDNLWITEGVCLRLRRRESVPR